MKVSWENFVLSGSGCAREVEGREWVVGGCPY